MNRKQIVIIVIAVLMVCMLFAFFQLNNAQNKNKYQWFEQYQPESHQPYGTKVIYQLLQKYFPEKAFYETDLVSDTLLPSSPSTFLYIGSAFNPSYDDANRLLSWVAQGHNAFIAARDISFRLAEAFGFDSCYYWDKYAYMYTAKIQANFSNQSLHTEGGYSFERYYKDLAISHAWRFIDSVYQSCSPGSYFFTELGYLENIGYNYIRIPYGAGQVYLHTNPILFSNFFLVKPSGKDYIEKVLSHLSPTDIYWCTNHSTDITENMAEPETPQFTQSPLQLILSQPSLRWGWYVLLSGVVLFIIFQARRKQRIVPVIEPRMNTSLEFAGIIGRLYFQQSDHKKLADLKMKHFLAWIRNHYHLKTHQNTTRLAAAIAQKSGVSAEEVEAIFEQYKALEQEINVTPTQLSNLNRAMENFYLKAK